MAYKALYNKYRPTTFDEVAGQRSIVRTMRNAIENNKIAHAYLFCGPRGTGKTSMARLFAKALNCEEGLGHQCNHCSNCLAMNSGSHPDVIEIDAASNNGVEQVRDLIDKVRYAPIRGKYKIYIIDEVHMMSAGAFNALLKTLEEPPEHVIFILATTEPFKVLPTIISRCQRYDFGKIDPKDIKDKLIWILNREGVPYEESALDAVVDLADGGMRDALSILDQALAYGGNQVREKDVLDVFGLTSTAQKCRLLDLIASGQVSPVLALAEEFLTSGIDIKRLVQALLDILKDILVYLKTGEEKLLQAASLKEIDALLGKIDDVRANEMIDVLIKCQADSKTVGNLRSLFELTLIRMTSLFGGAAVNVAPRAEAKPVAPAPQPKAEIKVEPKPEPKVEPKPEPKPEPKVEPQAKIEPAAHASGELFHEEPAEPNQSVYTGTTPPDWLFDEAPAKPKMEPKPEVKIPAEPVKKPAKPIFSEEKEEPEKPVAAPSLGIMASEGTPLFLDDETIVNIMVLGPKYKPQRQALFDRWNEIGDLRFDPKVGALAALLSEGRPFCLCSQALLINFNFTRQRDKANLAENQKAISDLVATVLGRNVFVYSLDRNDSNRCQKAYYGLKQIGKLPNPEDVILNLPK
ncbi:MAG: DNA polymerase III subunit gamma/tau [Bacilli bacterium]|nr:DNA polymerase III subunit gamma/tau [Bacilli bacterium]